MNKRVLSRGRRSPLQSLLCQSVCGLSVFPALAQEPVPLAHPDFTGVWSGYLTTADHGWWQALDAPCFMGCPAMLRQHVAELDADPANRDRPLHELAAELQVFMMAYTVGLMTEEGQSLLETSVEAANDLATYCEPYALLREAMNPLPMRIRDEGERLLFEYEEWSLIRSVDMTGSAVPATVSPSPLGYSRGHYEGSYLVIETSALTGDYYPGRMGRYSDEATIVERYVIEDEPRRLELELTITDSVTLKDAYVWNKTWLFTAGVELLQDTCEDIPGEF